MKGMRLRQMQRRVTVVQKVICMYSNHLIPRAGDWPLYRLAGVPKTPEQVFMDVPETSMKVSKGEPESPLQEASIGVPQTPLNYDIAIQVEIQGHACAEGESTDEGTMHKDIDSACAGITATQAHEFRHPCIFCRRRRYAEASTGSAASSFVQRFQEWALPYLADRKSKNDLFMRVLVAVGPTVEAFANIPHRTVKAVGRAWLEDRPLRRGTQCICHRHPMQTRPTDGRLKHYRNLSQQRSAACSLRLKMPSHACRGNRICCCQKYGSNGSATTSTKQSGATVASPTKIAGKDTGARRLRDSRTTKQNGDDSRSYEFAMDPKYASFLDIESLADIDKTKGALQNKTETETCNVGLLARLARKETCMKGCKEVENQDDRDRKWLMRYRGGGLAQPTNAQPKCFFCRTHAPAYVPRSCQDAYTARCTLCRRYACARCCEWELQKPYCWWCAKLGPGDSIAAHRLVTRGRATTTRLKHWQETPDWMDIVDFASNVMALQKCGEAPMQPRLKDFAHESKDTFMAILSSFFRDRRQLDKLLEQNWVPEWKGWEELRAQLSDEQCFTLAQRFMGVAQANQSQGSKSNDARIAELQTQGLKLVIASPHGENNCLIDTLLLGLTHLRVLEIPMDMATRKQICAECRVFLETEYGTPKGDFLDGMIEAPRILDYFTQVKWQRSVRLMVRMYDRFDHAGLGLAPEDDLNVFTFDGSKWGQPVATHHVHIFCHTADEGPGHAYHFDLLWPCNSSNANVNSKGSTKSVRNTNPSLGAVNRMPSCTRQSPSTKAEPTHSSASSDQHGNGERTNGEDERRDTAAWCPLHTAEGDKSLHHQSSINESTELLARQELMRPVLVSHDASAATQSHEHTLATTNARTTASESELRSCLQNFLNARSQAPILVGERDVTLLRAQWNNMAEVGAQLQVWLGASLPYFEPTRKNAHLLAKQWMRYYNARAEPVTAPETEKRSEGRGNAETPATTPTQDATAGPTSKRRSPPISSPKQKAAKHGAALDATSPAAGRATNQTIPRTRDEAPDVAERVDATEGQRRPAPKRRYRKKAPQDPEDFVENAAMLEQDEYWLTTWPREHGNPDPRAKKEAAIARLAALLRPQPALPHGMGASDPAFDLPNWHCAFKDCQFEAETYAELTDHILHQHVTALRLVTDLKLPPLAWEEAGMEAYRAAISCVCQDGAPLAHSAIDRRCLRQFQEAKDGDHVGAAICILCARRFPYVDTQVHPHGNRIQWRRLLNDKTDEFLNLPRAQVEEWFGYDAYCRNYASQHEPEAQAQLESELQDWQTTIRFSRGAPLRLICCPEDKVCSRRCPPETACPNCKAPVCQFCWQSVTKDKVLPAAALANDMLVFYAPKMIYQQEVTFMELICASPCFTAMCCFSLEKRLLGDRALDQDAFMPRQRLAARGNATTFPLAWEDILQHLEAAEAGAISLPRTGVELAETVSVVLKTMQASNDAEGLGKVIHQARVRRAIVLQLLQEAKDRGHPAYKHVNMLEASTRAQTLPEDGIPDEIVAVLPYDNDLQNVQRQKAATPVRENLTLEALAEELSGMCKPNAVVNEKSSAGIGDTNAQQVAALEALQRDGTADAGDSVLTVATGNRLLDQFQPWYFAFAFAYVFPFCTAMPDPPAWHAKPRYRRGDGAPRIELEAWVRCMARRCEAQINRDWVFGFVSWNLLFRSAVNLSRTVHTYGTPVYDERTNKFRTLTARDIEAGAVQLVRALNSQYIDSTGKPRPVNGDMSKLPYVQNLSPAARKLLKNMQHTARQLPGTQEARRQMRFEIEAMRIRYGVPLFVTFSPDESQQLLYIRMSRTRRSDPVRSASVWQEWQCGEREFPPLDEDRWLPVAVETVRRLVPCWEQRRRVLARDPLASVDGFHTLALLLLKYIFGLHMCPQCPNCATTWHPCIDTSGSNATVVGGVFGRVDAAYISIEAQKSTGSLHAHCQLFVQCLHQHTPLAEIFQQVESRLEQLRAAYLQYSAHVVHMTYSGQTEEQIARGIDVAEQTWPEHATDSSMTACPEYLRTRAAPRDVNEAERWARTYLEEDVVTLQYLKQHHYHPIDPDTGERKPLRGCEKKDRPGVCKSDFPRNAWLCAEAAVLCPCRKAKHGFPDHGRKNRLGALFGPCGHCWLNGCHPALLAAARGANVDVQVPYRLPCACATCGQQLTRRQRQDIALAAQRAQDAQTGYCCDYCAKNQPMGTHEIKEFQKGHVVLNARLQDEPLEQVGKKHMGRLI